MLLRVQSSPQKIRPTEDLDLRREGYCAEGVLADFLGEPELMSPESVEVHDSTSDVLEGFLVSEVFSEIEVLPEGVVILPVRLFAHGSFGYCGDGKPS